MTPIGSLLLDAYDAAIAACDPERAVASTISVDDTGLTIGGHRFDGAAAQDVVVVAIGKAASAMVRGIVSAIGPVRGLAMSNHEESCPVPLLVGSHPVPDDTSLVCGEAALSFVGGLSRDDVVVYLISGGGSSIAVAPADGVSLEDLQRLNQALMSAGIPIRAMNEVRAAVSRIKGGGLAAGCAAERSVTLVLSDVVGAGPSHVASGPSLGAGMGADASTVVSGYGISDMLPAAVRDAIDRSTPSTGPPQPFTVVGSSAVSAEAAASFLNSRGAASVIVTTELEGEARTEALRLVHDAAPGVVGIASGETTVNILGDGVGGRNQEAALAVAIDIAGEDITFLACGTDGIDGPTPAAGAVVDGGTAARAAAIGIDLERSLSRNDSHTALSSAGATVVRGDTGTNVADLWMVANTVSTLPN